MKYFLSLILGVGTLFSASAAHAENQNDCFSCDSYQCCDLKSKFYVDYLYWQPCRSDLDYDAGRGNDRDYVNPKYHSAFRVGGNIYRGCWDLGLRYTSFCDSETRDPKGADKVTYKLDMDVVDLEVGRKIPLRGCNMSFRPFLGVKLSWIDEFFDDRNDDDDKTTIDFRGYGLYLGTDARWDLCCWRMCNLNVPVALISRGSVGVLHVDTHQRTDDDGDITNRGHQCLYSPVLEGYVGLEFTFCNLFCCRDAQGGNDAYFQIGYEVQNWGNFRRFNDSDETAAFGIGGLVTRFGFNF